MTNLIRPSLSGSLQAAGEPLTAWRRSHRPAEVCPGDRRGSLSGWGNVRKPRWGNGIRVVEDGMVGRSIAIRREICRDRTKRLGKRWCKADHTETAWPGVRVGAPRSEPTDATRATIARQKSERP